MDKEIYVDKVTEDFYKDLMKIITAGSEKGANKLIFTMPKPPEIEIKGDVEVMISWRLKE